MDWQLIFDAAVALGTIAIAILAIWGDWFRIKLVSPDLFISPYNVRGSLTTINFEVSGERTGNNFKAIYYHLKIINKRKWITVKNCKVILTSLHCKGPDGQFHLVPLIVPLQYIWSPAEWAPIQQTFNDEAVLDFGKVIEGFNRFEPTLYVISNNFKGFVGPNEVVRYTLQVLAENYIGKRTQTFEVAWDGKFNDNLDIMERSLIVKEVKDNLTTG
jgi:hypothetical protein